MDKLRAAQTIGNMRRRAPARKHERDTAAGPPAEGAPNATGFAHFQEPGTGITLSPEMVLTLSLVFIAIVIVLHVVGKLGGLGSK